MVTNLPENAKAQWKRVVAARSPEEKLRELQKFYAMIPKHKGTKNLVKYVRRKMASLREEIEEGKRKARGTRFVSSWSKKVEGVARVSITGDDQGEATALFERVTGREVDVHFVHEPIYGPLKGGGVLFEVALLPPVIGGGQLASKAMSFIPSSKAVFFVPSSPELESFSRFRELAEETGIIFRRPRGEVSIERLPSGGIRIVGSVMDATNEEVARLLTSYGIRSAVVKLFGEVSIDDVESEILGMRRYVPCYIARIVEGRTVLWDPDEGREEILESNDDLALFLLRKLSLIRIYTKLPKEEPSREPVVMKRGSTVEDLAGRIHSRLYKHFRYAVVWRRGKQVKVSRNFVLEDEDVVEIRAY